VTAVDLDAQPARPAPSFNPLALRQLWLSMDKNERVIEWAQSKLGIAVLHAAFLLSIAALPVIRSKHMALIAITLLLAALLPGRRGMVLTGMGVLFFLLRPFRNEFHYNKFGEIWSGIGLLSSNAQAGMVLCGLAFMGLILLLIENQRRKTVSVIAERPVLSMLIAGAALTALTLVVPQDGMVFTVAWLVLAYLSSTFFFTGYILMAARQKNAMSNTGLLGYVRPFWANSVVPIKGPGYLAKFEAKDAAALAVTRLKGLKLAVWAVILFWTGEIVFNQVVHSTLGLPHFEAHLKAVAVGGPASVALGWAVVAIYFLERVLVFGAVIHALVAVVRMAGFAIPRGIKPRMKSTQAGIDASAALPDRILERSAGKGHSIRTRKRAKQTGRNYRPLIDG